MLTNIWLVFKHAVTTTVAKKSFWIMTLLMPALMLGMLFFSQLTVRGETENGVSNDASPQSLPPIGLVDEANLIVKLPPGFPPDVFVRYPDQAAARSALEAGKVEQYIHIPADYLATGKITVYDKNFMMFASGGDMGLAYGSSGEWILGYIVNYNLTGSVQMASLMQNPTPIQAEKQHMVSPPVEEPSADNMVTITTVAMFVPYIFYFILIISSGYLMQSVTAEKENRTAEVLLLSVSPRELMLGKILGLGLVSLIQLVAWLGSAYALMNSGTDTMDFSAINLSPAIFLWALVYLILGYLMYGAIMTAGGALAPTAREGGQLTWLLVLPLLPTLMFISEYANNPQGSLPVILSLFPLTAPSSMVTRMVVADVPGWQLAVSLCGVIITAYVFVSLAAHFFRADTLLSNTSFSWKRVIEAWKK